MNPRVEKSRKGGWVLRELPPVLVLALAEVPRLLDPGDAEVDARLLPNPYPGDPARTEEWRRHALPDLRHLFASAREIVRGDLAGLRAERFPARGVRVNIPERHLPAWLSALATARVALGTRHAFGTADLEAPFPEEIRTPRERALLILQLLAEVQVILVEGPRGKPEAGPTAAGAPPGA